MESVRQVKQALSAKSRTATLDELKSEGRKRVRLIRAEHVAAMISEAVHNAIQNSGLIPKEEADRLVEASRKEFKNVINEREQEVRETREVASLLAEKTAEVEELRGQLEKLQSQIESVAAAGAAPGGAAGAAAGTAGAAGAVAAGSVDLSAALDKLASTLNERLDKFGRKMGISGAVEADEVKLDALFAKDDDVQLESNMDSVNVKKKTGGGIASNLERLKKLKGGGS